MRKAFKIKSMRYPQWFWVYVYDDIKELRKASTNFDEMAGFDNGDYKHILGICQGYKRLIEKNNHDKVHNNIGIIRLARKHLSPLVVSHEVLHASIHTYRFHHKVLNLGKNVEDKEEELAHIYGELFSQMTKKLDKYK